ncbi:unnamed protein product [Protopolystoma xenopodis]|uniref:Uncharacterized protein n=1 Tax=Protopolystoma xenopodis TaxID=117903 RepID=A0A448XF85_9PLAT|nr:unnamed protein product [Protopolystoma xenopodis]
MSRHVSRLPSKLSRCISEGGSAQVFWRGRTTRTKENELQCSGKFTRVKPSPHFVKWNESQPNNDPAEPISFKTLCPATGTLVCPEYAMET